jgi:lipopolysaccharide/colanic/teichoic acid biosynthesis glycosyltransferase
LNQRLSNDGSLLGAFRASAPAPGDREILAEAAFHKKISLERKRAERSRKAFLLMLVALGNEAPTERTLKILEKTLKALALCTRETDVSGWYKLNAIAGVMFTDIEMEERTGVLKALLGRLSETLQQNLSREQFNQLSIQFHVFPEDWDHDMPERRSNPTLYPDLANREESRKLPQAVKRAMDILGSMVALMLFSPIFLAIAVGIKLTSCGPVLFCQRRIGQHGVAFSFLKFRSMYVNNDATTHRAYIKRLIAGTAETHSSNGNGNGVYKLTNDIRITPFGGFLRKTSLDELPQLLNVLVGDMSLVGPRPPIAYEVEHYDIWHRSRVLEAKPGITGLWQVCGRSRVKFDEMVRLDLRYARNWTPWLDIQILMRTPKAVLSGDGAH